MEQNGTQGELNGYFEVLNVFVGIILHHVFYKIRVF